MASPPAAGSKRKTELVWLSPKPLQVRRRVPTLQDALPEAGPAERRAKTVRTSIAARPPPPSARAMARAEARVQKDRDELRGFGYTEIAPDFSVVRDTGVVACAPGRLVSVGGSTPESARAQQLLANHLVTVRSRSIVSQPRHASWLVPKRCPLMGEHLLEAALRANSVNSVLFGKKPSECSSLQISRHNLMPISDAQAAQQAGCLFVLARARALLKHNLVELAAADAVSMAGLGEFYAEQKKTNGMRDELLFPVPSTTQLACNILPTKMTGASLGSVGRDLARAELTTRKISNEIGTVHVSFLRKLCAQCVGQSANGADALWSAVGLLAHCAATAAGRALLAQTNLTEFDHAVSSVLEAYGHSEIQRRERFDGSATGTSDPSSSEMAVDEEMSAFEAYAQKELSDTQAQLSSKKRRDASAVDPNLSSAWWVRAATTKHSCVLKTLMANSERDAERAAIENLTYQAREHPGVVENATLQNVSTQNAKDCVRAVAQNLVCTPQTNVPHFVREGSNVALQRTADELKKTAIFATKFAPEKFQPQDAGVLAWSVANLQVKAHNVFEKLALAERMRLRESGKLQAARAERVEMDAWTKTDGAKTVQASALARSFFCHNVRHVLNDTQTAAAREFARSAEAVMQDESEGVVTTREQFATCSPGLATGLLVTDILTRWIAGKPRKLDFCKLQLGTSLAGEKPAPIPDLNSSAPLPMAVITDVTATAKADAPDTYSVGLSIALDGALRLPEVLARLSVGFDSRSVGHCHALLWAGISQASLIGNLGNVLSCGSVNTSIACSRRLTIADNTRWLGLSVFDCFTGGLVNVEPMFTKSPYAGTYGPVFDTGLSAPGKEGGNLKHDGRQHGSFSLSQQLSDELCGYFSKKHFAVSHETKTYVPTPVATRGIPHMMLAGIHSALDGYVDALEELRTISGREDSKTVEGLFVLPFSAVTQSLPPTTEEFADSAATCGVRSDHVKRGYAHQPTATAEEEALLQAPLFRRPSVSTVNDNPFVTAYDYAESFYNVSCGIVMLARLLQPSVAKGQCRFDALLDEMERWICGAETPGYRAVYAADALVMLSACFPHSHEIAKDLLAPFLATGVPALHRFMQSGADAPECAPGLPKLVDDEQLESAQVFLKKVKKAWPRLVALYRNLDELNGRHDLTLETRRELRHRFDEAVRASYFFQCDESGTVPYGNPAFGASCCDEIRRAAVDPVIVGVEEEREEARGGVMGVKPFALRQIALLAMGAHLENVVLQCARNEGGLNLRVSSAPDVLDATGGQRTNKAVSPLQMESDAKTFGTREEKLVTCKQQREAWDRNCLLLAPVFGEVSVPRPASYRHRCKNGAHREAAKAAVAASAALTVSPEEQVAKQHILRAAAFQQKRHDDAADGGRCAGAGKLAAGADEPETSESDSD